jgi:hypothetical protein
MTLASRLCIIYIIHHIADYRFPIKYDYKLDIFLRRITSKDEAEIRMTMA